MLEKLTDTEQATLLQLITHIAETVAETAYQRGYLRGYQQACAEAQGKHATTCALKLLTDLEAIGLDVNTIGLNAIGLNAFENSIVAYLGKQPKATRRLIRTNQYRAKPWSEIPKDSLTAKINETVDSLISKRIVIESETFDAHGNSEGKYLRLIS